MALNQTVRLHWKRLLWIGIILLAVVLFSVRGLQHRSF
jgi:hypothetical protein